MTAGLKTIVAALIIAGLAAVIASPREASTVAPAVVPATTFTGSPTREQCGALFREMLDAASAPVVGADLVANDKRFYAKRAQYNEQCGTLCTPGGCQ